MGARRTAVLVFAALTICGTAEGQPPAAPLNDYPPTEVAQQPATGQPQPTPPRTQPPTTPPRPAAEPERPATERPTEARDTISPFGQDVFASTTSDIVSMMGDRFGTLGQRLVCVPITRTEQVVRVIFPPEQPPPPPPGTQPRIIIETKEVFECQPAVAAVPLAVRPFKIAENESPRPRDRLLFSYNYYTNVADELRRVPGGGFNVHREIFGFEKTFLDGCASIGMRLPLFTFNNDSNVVGLGGTDFEVGDLGIILKYAFYLDPQNPDTFSGGLVITPPTGADTNALVRTTYLQPWLGYIYTTGDIYLHGFFSVEFPLDDEDVTIMYNDVGIGYYLFRAVRPDDFLTLVMPMAELHINTPLNHRGLDPNDPFGTPDWVVCTLNTIFGFYGRSYLAAGLAFPVTGPMVYDMEALVHFNYVF